jgi:uncharacterized protein (UPF0332 family)
VLPRDLLRTATDLVNSSRGKPRQAHLRRAVSTAYYAMFHTLAKCCADLLVGGRSSSRSEEAWVQVYRALEHGPAKNACMNQNTISKFPKEIHDFANMFVQMQLKRHKADYDPSERIFKSAVLADISAVKAVIDDFGNASLKDRRAFAALVLLKQRS